MPFFAGQHRALTRISLVPWVWLCLCWSGATIAHGHETQQTFLGRLPFKVYGPDHGLPSGTPTDITFDSRGFLWLGTEGGLYRYEGGRFKKQRLGDTSNAWIQDLLPARQGGVWFFTQRHVYHYHNGVTTPVLRMDTNQDRPLLALDPAGDLLIAWRKQILKVESHHHQLTTLVPHDPNLSGPIQPFSFHCGPRSGLCRLISGQQLWVINGHRFESIDTGIQEAPLSQREDGSGCVWITTKSNLYKIPFGETRAQKMTHLLPGPFFRDTLMEVDPKGRVWIPTSGGLLAVNGDHHETLSYKDGIPMPWVRKALYDPEGNLWITGTTLARLLGQGSVRNHGVKDGLPVDIAWSFYEDHQKRMWVGTHQGLCTLGPKGWKLQPGTEGNVPMCMTEDRDGNLWIGANMSHLQVLRKGKIQVENVSLKAGKHLDPRLARTLQMLPYTPSMTSLEADLWVIVTAAGLLRVDPKTGAVLEKVDPCGIDSSKIHLQKIRKDSMNRLWLSSSQGLFCRTESGTWLNLKEGLKQAELLGVEVCDQGNEAWIHYDGAHGLSRVRLEQGKLKVMDHLTEDNGLISNMVLGLACDPNGRLWISTDQGVDVYQQGRFTHYGLGRGLAGEDGCEHGIWANRNGDVWVASSRGISHIMASHTPEAPKPPLCYLTSILQKEKVLGLPFPDRPRIPSKDATLEFRFESPTYRDESQLRFQVRMIGLEPEWREVEEHTSRYASLKGGHYVFEVRAGALGEAWGPPARYAFTVLSPWWQRWWAIALGLIALSQAIWSLMRMRVRKLLKEKARSEALLIQKTQDLQIASHRLLEANKALETMSLIDPLTGLYNRRYLPTVIGLEAERSIQTYRAAQSNIPLPNQDLTIFVINLDNLNFINQHYGHAAGDAIIKRTAQLLKGLGRETDWVIRMSGDSFLLLARSCSRKDAPAIAERIRASMAQQKLPFEKTELAWTCSVGFASLPFQLTDLDWMGWEKVLELADACLCMAKDAGRNTWLGVQAKPELTAKTHGPQLPWEMQKLVEEGVLELYSNSASPFQTKRKTL